jgi:hypothetical protein
VVKLGGGHQFLQRVLCLRRCGSEDEDSVDLAPVLIEPGETGQDLPPDAVLVQVQRAGQHGQHRQLGTGLAFAGPGGVRHGRGVDDQWLQLETGVADGDRRAAAARSSGVGADDEQDGRAPVRQPRQDDVSRPGIELVEVVAELDLDNHGQLSRPAGQEDDCVGSQFCGHACGLIRRCNRCGRARRDRDAQAVQQGHCQGRVAP